MIHEALFYSSLGVFFTAVISIILVVRQYKYKCLEKMITKKMVDKPLFSSLVVKEFVKYFFKYQTRNKNKIIKFFTQNDWPAIINNIKVPLLKAKMEIIISNKITRVKKTDSLYKLEQAFYWLKKQRQEKALELLGEIHTSKKEITALKKLLLVQISLSEGDLEIVSQEITRILPILKKQRMYAEEAFAYYIMGTAYRITGLYDTAEFMLRTSLAIYKFLSAKLKTAEIMGNLGLLMAAQRRYEEACSYYNEAQACISVKENRELYYFIDSQKAMVALMQGQYKEAELSAQKALKGHRSNAGKSLATDVLARICYSQKKWQKAYKWSNISAKYYLKEKNYASVFECWYLAAESLIEINKCSEAESLLRKLIDEEKYHKSCFHIANAYTLLGLILLKKEDLIGAKTFFNQSLKQEFYNERNTGIAIDYANLAVVERKCGNSEEACENLKKALLYAKDYDNDLYDKINATLN